MLFEYFSNCSIFIHYLQNLGRSWPGPSITNGLSVLYSCGCSVMRVTWCARRVAPNSRVAPLAAVSLAGTFAIWPWKRWPPPSCSRVAIRARVVAPPSSIQRSSIMRRPVSFGLTRVLVQGPRVNGKALSSKSCRISCKSTRASPHSKARISSSSPPILICPEPWIGSWCKVASDTISCKHWMSQRNTIRRKV